MYCLWALEALCYFALIVSVAKAEPSSPQYVDTQESFRYDLFLTDIQCWIDGACSGRIIDAENRSFAQRLDRVISTTKKSIDLAVFGLRNQDWFVERLTFLKKKGVEIRVTLDQLKGQIGEWDFPQNFVYPDSRKFLSFLDQNLVKVDVNADGSVRTGSIMHHKFFILDKKSVWFGSTNISDTESGTEYSADSSLLIHSKFIASEFSSEFDQMFTHRRYSIHKLPRSMVKTYRYIDGTRVTALFSPQDHPIDSGVVPFINRARRSIDIGIFYLTSISVAQALVDAHQRGVEVRIINDATAASNLYSHNEFMRSSGIDVRVENWGGKMHMKSAVRDHRDVLIGSANWTAAGNDKNDEHLVIVENNPKLAGELTQYFDSLWTLLQSSFDPNYRDPRAEGFDSINSCFDGIDNDHRGGIDQSASGCH